MVGTSNEQFARIRKIDERRDDMTDIDWRVIGTRTVRLTLPLDCPTLQRSFIPDQLRGLANQIESMSHRSDISLREQIREIKHAIRVVDWTIAEKSGRRDAGK